MSARNSAGPAAGYSSQARQEAHQILSRPPFSHPTSRAPVPFAGVLHAIGHGIWWLIGRPLAWLWRHVLVHVLTGIHAALGPWWPLPVAVFFVGLGLVTGWLLARRRSRIAGALVVAGSQPEREDAAALERAAVEAEQLGDLGSAVRLRYRAGLNRLEAKGIVTGRLTRTDGQLRLIVRDPTFDELSDRHESIAYGSRPATPEDVAASREGWPRVLAGAASGTGHGTFDEGPAR